MNVLHSVGPLASTPPDWASVMTAIATAAAALIALAALLGAVYQLRQNAISTREALAHRYLARYNEASRIPYTAKMQEFMSLKGTTKEARIREWEAMSYQQQLETVNALNFWEELAGMYNRNQVDQAIVRDYFGTAALAFAALSAWFIEYQQGGSQKRAMQQLEVMCRDIRRHREKAGETVTL